MNFNQVSVTKATGTMSVLGQILTAIGIVGVLLGAFSLVMGLITEFREIANDGPPSTSQFYGMEGAVLGATMLFWGLALAAGGATLHAIRSIAINCAKMADAKDQS
jgi:hypothetical protein